MQSGSSGQNNEVLPLTTSGTLWMSVTAETVFTHGTHGLNFSLTCDLQSVPNAQLKTSFPLEAKPPCSCKPQRDVSWVFSLRLTTVTAVALGVTNPANRHLSLPHFHPASRTRRSGERTLRRLGVRRSTWGQHVRVRHPASPGVQQPLRSWDLRSVSTVLCGKHIITISDGLPY